MKKLGLILLFVGAFSLAGCVTTQSTTSKTKQNTEQSKSRYFGTGVGIGFMAF